MASKTNTHNQVQGGEIRRKIQLLVKDASNNIAREGGHTSPCLVMRRSHQKWRMMSGTTLTFAQRRRSYYAYQMRSSTIPWTRRQLLNFDVSWRVFTWWRVCQTCSSWRSSYTTIEWRKVSLFYNISILSIGSWVILLALKVKLQEDKTLMLLSYLPLSL